MTSDPASATIVRLRRDQLHWAGEVLSQSHADYPAFCHTFPGPAERRKALRVLFRGIAADALRFESVYAAETDDGVVHGVAIWLPPRMFPWSAWRQARGAPWLLSVLRIAPRSFPTFMRTGINASRLHPSDPHWYLEVMGVTPAAQGRGLGGRMLEPVLEIADREGSDCYLETANADNVGFYKRHGFDVENDALPLVPRGPTHVAMRRRGKAAIGTSLRAR